MACHNLDVKAATLPRGTSFPKLDAAASRHQLIQDTKNKEEEYRDLLDQHMYLSVLYPESQPVALLLETAQEKKREISKLVISPFILTWFCFYYTCNCSIKLNKFSWNVFTILIVAFLHLRTEWRSEENSRYEIWRRTHHSVSRWGAAEDECTETSIPRKEFRWESCT